MPSTKLFFSTGMILLVLLTAIAGYAYSQILSLSLPMSEVYAVIALLLPLVTAVSTQAAYLFFSTNNSYTRPVIYLLVLAFQLIYETIIATLSLAYIAPSCRFEEQWGRLYRNKEADAIRRIQDRSNCCGLNTVVDRAWPFPRGRPEEGHGADQCQRTFGRVRPCLGPWRRAEQISAGLFFTVAVVIFLVKLVFLIYQARNTSSWTRFSRSITPSGINAHLNGGTDRRLALGESERVAPEEEYYDDIDSRPEDIAANDSGNRSRIEPSGVGTGKRPVARRATDLMAVFNYSKSTNSLPSK